MATDQRFISIDDNIHKEWRGDIIQPTFLLINVTIDDDNSKLDNATRLFLGLSNRFCTLRDPLEALLILTNLAQRDESQ
jgi:hypothetical protein